MLLSKDMFTKDSLVILFRNIVTKDNLILFLLLLPALVSVGYFVYYTILWNVIVSVSNWEGLKIDYTFKGFDQYFKLFNDEVFLISLTNNIMLIVLFVPLCLLVGLSLAILMDQKVRYEGVFRTIYLLPFTLSFVVTAYLWLWMYNPQMGVINTLLRRAGLGFLASQWIADPNIVLLCIVIALVWQFGGYVMLIFLAGIKSLPDSQLKAAMVDGASGFYLYRRIVIPQIKASTFTAFVVLMVFALKAFDFIYVLTGGGPGYASEILPLTMYQESFAVTHFATGSAIATILFCLVLLIIVPYLYRTYRVEK
ncbi:MAG: carbohydrate ABC transporter permease [Promethearchaeota archaeon]